MIYVQKKKPKNKKTECLWIAWEVFWCYPLLRPWQLHYHCNNIEDIRVSCVCFVFVFVFVVWNAKHLNTKHYYSRGQSQNKKKKEKNWAISIEAKTKIHKQWITLLHICHSCNIHITFVATTHRLVSSCPHT